jgi:flagellar FliL protein
VAITIFSGHTIAQVSDPATRDSLKAALKTALAKAYDGEVMDVYLTDYVTQ